MARVDVLEGLEGRELEVRVPLWQQVRVLVGRRGLGRRRAAVLSREGELADRVGESLGDGRHGERGRVEGGEEEEEAKSGERIAAKVGASSGEHANLAGYARMAGKLS